MFSLRIKGAEMWALVQDEVVLETTEVDPEGRYHADLKWRSCPPQVQAGWRYVNAVFVEPVHSRQDEGTIERAWRDAEITLYQWLRDRHRDELDLGRPTTFSDVQFLELLNYLQRLRDWPQDQHFPDRSARPVSPDWINLYT
ncbi:phage tail assembly chaperone [Pseudomonas sp. BCRC 81390]|uniref:phage tail assembly chaperone n=1 Tax=Pseudomonas sp. BCRC 81390 TaxID=3054778 RepID=UPI00259536EA|nr:phage tail assembly chaperone [Pseudomonas sp. BCRC 81390]MDM3888343.1 phage tail assembly chaperone [Pseudomonas sp. BCRC 81390]